MDNQLMNLNNYSPEQLQLMQDQITAIRMKNIEKQLLQTRDDIKKIDEKITILTEENKNAVDVAIQSLRANHTKYGYVSQGDFGRFFEVSIGSKTIGKLLRVVGLAMKTKGDTTPYRSMIPKYAETSINKINGYDRTTIRWHYENCLDKIEEWLKEYHYYEKFYSMSTEKEMKIFIDDLYDEYVNNN